MDFKQTSEHNDIFSAIIKFHQSIQWLLHFLCFFSYSISFIALTLFKLALNNVSIALMHWTWKNFPFLPTLRLPAIQQQKKKNKVKKKKKISPYIKKKIKKFQVDYFVLLRRKVTNDIFIRSKIIYYHIKIPRLWFFKQLIKNS